MSEIGKTEFMGLTFDCGTVEQWLEEVLSADLILHVRDISHPETEEQRADVVAILESLGIDNHRAMIEVWNKIDQVDDPEPLKTQAARAEDVVVTSALSDAGLQPLLDAVEDALSKGLRTETLTISHAEGRKRAWLFDQGVVEEEAVTEEGWSLTVTWSDAQAARFARL